MFWPSRLKQPEQFAKPNENRTGPLKELVYVSIRSDSGMFRDYVKDVVIYMEVYV